MKHINPHSFLAFIFSFFSIYTYAISNSPDSLVHRKIKELKDSGVNLVVEYYVQQPSKEQTLIIDTMGNTSVSLTSYLFWIKNGRYFRQKFTTFETFEETQLIHSPFLDTVKNNVYAIKDAEIKSAQHQFPNGQVILKVNEGDITKINIHIGLNPCQTIYKWIYHDPIDKKMIDKKTPNDNYEINQNSILKQLRDLVEKEI